MPSRICGDAVRNSATSIRTFIEDYYEKLEEDLFGAVLDAARVTHGTRLVDAGCGAGLLAVLATFRGVHRLRA
jgi:cyclopropane fatty-acyl-phospholipid synthase-like methyltransferase